MDGWMDMTKLIVAFRNFTNAPKNSYFVEDLILLASYTMSNAKYRFPFMVSRYVPMDAGFLCDNPTALSDSIKGTPVVTDVSKEQNASTFKDRQCKKSPFKTDLGL
jgi:hypothetical protein